MKSKPSYRTIICLSAQCIVFLWVLQKIPAFFFIADMFISLPGQWTPCLPLKLQAIVGLQCPIQQSSQSIAPLQCTVLESNRLSILLPFSMQCTQGHRGHQRTLHQPLDIDRIRKDQIDHLASHLNRYFHQCDLRSTGLATVQSSLGAAARAIRITSSHSPNAGELRDKIIILPHKNGEQFSVTNLGTIPTFSRFSNGECPLSLSTTKESTT